MAVYSTIINIGQLVPSTNPATMTVSAVGTPVAFQGTPASFIYTTAALNNLVIAGFSYFTGAMPTILTSPHIAWSPLGSNATVSLFYGLVISVGAGSVATNAAANPNGTSVVQEFASSQGSANIGWVLLGGGNASGTRTGSQGIDAVPLSGNGVNGIAAVMAEQQLVPSGLFGGAGTYTWTNKAENASFTAEGQFGYRLNATGVTNPTYTAAAAVTSTTNNTVHALFTGVSLGAQSINAPIQPVPSGLMWVVSMVTMETILAGGTGGPPTTVTANVMLNNRLVIGNLNANGGIFQGPPYIPMSSKDVLTVALSSLVVGSQYVINLYYDEYPANQLSAYALSAR